MTSQRPFNGRVIFDHLPKTAGTAVNAWLVSQLGAGSVTTNLNGFHRKLIRYYGGEYPVISGHVAFSGEGLDPRYQYITCLREPLDRAVSWLFFVANNRDEAQLGALWHQTRRFLNSDGDELGSDVASNISNIYVEHFASIVGSVSPTDSAKLAAALAAIEQYDVWGLYEALPGFMTDIAAMIGITAPGELPKVNATRVRPLADGISSKLRKRLLALNQLDMRFYDLLRKRWHCREQPMGSLPQTSPWLSYSGTAKRTFSASDFCLLSITLGGDSKVVPWQILTFTLLFSLAATVDELEIGIHVFDEDDQWAFGTNTTLLERKLFNVKPGTHRLQYCLVANMPEGVYSAGFAFADRQPDGDRQLAWFDKLVGFSVAVLRPQACVGYASLPVEVTCSQTSDVIFGLVEYANGTIRVDALLGDAVAGELLKLPVVLKNLSPQIWTSSHHNPIVLSYHWFDAAGGMVLFEGDRTPLPVLELRPGGSVRVSMRVLAPATPGLYKLVLLPVQEGRAWFDQYGFIPEKLDLLVQSPAIGRRYVGADMRLATQSGRREGTVLVATGQEGFLLFGPYAALQAGNYVARVQGTFVECVAGAWMDVVCASGAEVLAKIDLCSSPRHETEVSVSFELKTDCRDLEVRVWVPTNVRAVIEALLIEPVQHCRHA